jgi:tRNA pseudouridine55 synthase
MRYPGEHAVYAGKIPDSAAGQRAVPQQDGVLVLDKPGGLTSAACIGLLKKRLGQKKIGHAGTLDPMATGVLLVLLGQATKISGQLMEAGRKIYLATVKFGLDTDTWDVEGKVLSETPLEHALNSGVLSFNMLKAELAGWVGTMRQQVPPYSAAKHAGRPLYALARKGLETPYKDKTIEISRAELEWFRPPLARFRIACGSGTYIRSLAHSLGIRFECGAVLAELVREYSHPYALDTAVNLDELLANPELLPQKTRSIASALAHLPAFRLDQEAALKVRNGNMLPLALLPEVDGNRVLFLDSDGRELALAEKSRRGGEEFWRVGRGLWN